VRSELAATRGYRVGGIPGEEYSSANIIRRVSVSIIGFVVSTVSIRPVALGTRRFAISDALADGVGRCGFGARVDVQREQLGQEAARRFHVLTV